MNIYDGKTFRSAANTANGEVGAETLFHYHQDGETVWAEYRYHIHSYAAKDLAKFSKVVAQSAEGLSSP